MYMGKQNPYKFSIGFNSENPTHRRAAEILNGMSKGKADLIANALLQYLGEADPTVTGINIENFQSLIQELVHKEVEKAMEGSVPVSKDSSSEVMDLTEDEPVAMDADMLQGIANAMEIFRKS